MTGLPKKPVSEEKDTIVFLPVLIMGGKGNRISVNSKNRYL